MKTELILTTMLFHPLTYYFIYIFAYLFKSTVLTLNNPLLTLATCLFYQNMTKLIIFRNQI